MPDDLLQLLGDDVLVNHAAPLRGAGETLSSCAPIRGDLFLPGGSRELARCRGAVPALVQDDAVPEQRVEERITGVIEAHHIDFDPRGVAQVRRQLQQVEIFSQHRHIGVRVGAGSAAGPGPKRSARRMSVRPLRAWRRASTK